MSAPTPILYIHHEKALGGAPLSLLYLIRQLDRARYSPHVICLREGPAADLFRKEGIPLQILPGPDLSHTELVWFRWWQFPRLLWRLLLSIPLFFRLRNAFSALHVPLSTPLVHLNSSTLVTAALAGKSAGLKVVWHIREPLSHGYLGVRRALLRAGIRKWADQVIAISQNDADQLGNMPSDKISVIYNFVDFKQFDASISPTDARKKLELPQNGNVVLFLGGLSRVKGTGILFQMASLLEKRSGESMILIAGETGPARSLIGATSRNVRILGPRRDIPEWLSACDLLVFPSIVPHFARPVIEAAAMGKPVVASDLGGVRELVIPGETGLLVPPGDPEALAKAVGDLLNDPARRKRMGERALALAHEKFDAACNSKRTFEVYEKI